MFRFALASALATADAATLDLTWSDCGAKHATVTDVSPSAIHTGATETITGTGTLDEEVTSAQFTATVSALGTKLTDCSGDATSDIVCTLPMGVGTITVKAVDYPLAAGTVQIPVEVKTSSIIPPSLASIDVAIKATEQNNEDVICLNVHTEQEKEEVFVGATLDLTWSDCGAKHATVTDVSPSAIHTGATETITGTGTLDEEVTSAQFTATVSALGTKLTDCSGDATSDIVCTLPMGVGTITVKAVDYPLAAGTVQIPVEVKTSSIIPPSLASIDVAIKATEQNNEDVICLNVHTEQEKKEAFVGATLDLTWSDCGAKHATVTDVSPSAIHTGATETITGTGTLDEEVTSAQFTATVSALGTKLTDCSGDATSDIVCTLPMGVGTITVKAVDYPLAAGTVQIPVEVKTSSIIPPSLASIDVAIKAIEQNGEDVICLNVHTEQEQFLVSV